MPSNPPSPGRPRKVSRRQFAREATLATAAAALLPASSALAQQASAPSGAADQRTAADYARLSAASQAEVEAKYQAVLRRYGSRFTAAQKNEVRRQLVATQKALDLLRAFPLENSDAPATTFRVSGRPPQPPRKTAAKAGKP